MSEIYKWSTLDNSDAITISNSEDNTYYTVTSADNTSITLSAPVGRYERTVKSWTLDGIYGAENVGGYYFWKCGVYGFKTGYIKKIKIYFDEAVLSGTDTALIHGFALGFCRGTEVELKFKTNILERNEEDNSITLELKATDEYYIDNSIIENTKNGLLIIPLSESAYDNEIISPGIKDGNVFQFLLQFRNAVDELQPRVKCYPRSIFDAGSSLINHGDSTTGAIDYILKMELTFEVDGVKDHITEDGNFNVYHLSQSTVSNLDTLKYYAPIPKTKENVLNYLFDKIYISHESLTINNNISLENKSIESLQIPIDTANDWRDNPDGNFFSQNVKIKIGLGENPSTFVEADNTLAMKKVNGREIVWNIKFSKNPLTYSGTDGITILVRNEGDTASGLSCVRVYDDESTTTSDKIYKGSSQYNITPNIRVIFDFDGRAQFMEMLYRKIMTN